MVPAQGVFVIESVDHEVGWRLRSRNTRNDIVRVCALD